MPARRASRARRTTWCSTSSATSTLRRSPLFRLVRTVTAKMRGRRMPSRRQARVTSACVRSIISKLPEAWTSKNRTPSRAAATPAFATVCGMSWNLRSRKTSAPCRRTMRTTSGPAARKSCFPILKMPTSLARRRTRRSASAGVSTSSANMRRCRRASARGGR